jgi:hypothetical protein
MVYSLKCTWATWLRGNQSLHTKWRNSKSEMPLSSDSFLLGGAADFSDPWRASQLLALLVLFKSPGIDVD